MCSYLRCIGILILIASWSDGGLLARSRGRLARSSRGLLGGSTVQELATVNLNNVPILDGNAAFHVLWRIIARRGKQRCSLVKSLQEDLRRKSAKLTQRSDNLYFARRLNDECGMNVLGGSLLDADITLNGTANFLVWKIMRTL